MPKFVVSTTRNDLAWNNSTLISGHVVEEVAKLKEHDGGDILVAGSASLVATLMANDLVDELRLMVFPIVLGAGKRLFAASAEATTLRLANSRALDSGTLILTYHPAL